jgi:membrane protease YdiL (CAAX protease family)
MTNNDHTLTPPGVASPRPVQVATEPKRRWYTAVRTVLVIPAAFLPYAPLLALQFLPMEKLGREGNWGLVTVITMVPFVLMTLTAVFVVWLFMHFLDRRPLWQAGIRVRRQDPAALALGIAVSLVAEFAVSLWATRVGWVPEVGGPGTGSMAPTWVLFVGVVIGQGFLMQGIPEELFYRGYLTQTLGGGRVRRAVIAALVFGSIHIASNGGEGPVLDRIVYCGHAAAFGFAAAALYFATGSLWHIPGFVVPRRRGAYVLARRECHLRPGGHRGPGLVPPTGLIVTSVGVGTTASTAGLIRRVHRCIQAGDRAMSAQCSR